MSILKEIESTGVGVDISPYAIQNARENAVRFGFVPADPSSEDSCTSRVKFMLGDFARTYGKFESIVSNPPYIIPNPPYIIPNPPYIIPNPSNSIHKTALTDPPIALFDAHDSSFSCYQQIIASDNLLPGGRIAFEIPEHALMDTIEFAEAYGFSHEFNKEIGREIYMCILEKSK